MKLLHKALLLSTIATILPLLILIIPAKLLHNRRPTVMDKAMCTSITHILTIHTQQGSIVLTVLTMGTVIMIHGITDRAPACGTILTSDGV